MNVSDLKDKIVACCGLVCSDCPAYQATQANDEAKIAEIVKQWAVDYNVNVTPESVWCDGCTQPGRKCGHCAECEIRECATERPVENCGLCDVLPHCQQIQGFFKMAPLAKEVILAIAENRKC
jgi:hypothetical protein